MLWINFSLKQTKTHKAENRGKVISNWLYVVSGEGKDSGVVIKIFDKFGKKAQGARSKANSYFQFRGFRGKKCLSIIDMAERDIDKSLMMQAPC